jgi:hypothetical protein
MTPEPLKDKRKDLILYHGEYSGVVYKYGDIKSAVAGLIKFHEDKIEKLVESLKLEKKWSKLILNYIEIEYESIMAIEHWLEDVI